jgi:hypothetical protein
MPTYKDYYRKARAEYWLHPQHYCSHNLALHQLRQAKYRTDIETRWQEADDLVRLDVQPDDFADLDNLFGDTFDAASNPDIPPARLEREKQNEIDRINQDGVWGIVGQYKCPKCGQWCNADSVWGFIGDDWQDTGYELDVMNATLACLEATRCAH